MIDIRLLRSDPDGTRSALGRRGVLPEEIDALLEADGRALVAARRRDEARSEVRALSRRVAEARRGGDDALAAELQLRSRAEGERISGLEAEAAAAGAERRERLLVLPNLPSHEAPEGSSAEDNVVLRAWTPPGRDGYPPHQRVPHWEVGAELGILDLERGAKLSGSMFPLFRGAGARLVRALTALALDRHSDAFEEIRPPTLVRTATMVSTGHLPKFADDAYHLERDDLWAIPTAEVPLTSLARDEVLEESELPRRMTAATSCFRREAGAAGRDTRGLLRVHEFDKVELFAYCTPDQSGDVHDDLLSRAESLLRDLGLQYRVLDLCAGDLGSSACRTFDLEAYAPGTDQWLEVSSVSWFSDYQARRANVRYRPAAGGPPSFVHTVNGSAMAWPRVWAALVESGRLADGSLAVPEALLPWMGGVTTITAPAGR
ncbi:MAG: serine--tRNA ligase [Acidimicrobiales bacterium]